MRDKIRKFSDFCKENGLRGSEFTTQLGEVETEANLEIVNESDVYASVGEVDSQWDESENDYD